MFNVLLASQWLANRSGRLSPLAMASQDPWGERPENGKPSDKPKASGSDGPPDLDELFAKLIKRKPNSGGNKGGNSNGGMPSLPPVSAKMVVLIIAAAVVAWLATGIYTVQERENGVETVLGRYTDTTKAGLNWNWPMPIGSVEKVDVTSISTMRVGEFKTQKGSISTSSQRNGQMLTSDENIVEIGAAVQYRIGNAKNFLFQAEQPVDILEDIVISAIREVVGANSVDEILRDRRNEWPQQAKNIIIDTLKQYDLGFEIIAFELQDARAPAEVQDAFEDAVRAREDEERLRLQAEAFARERLPVARGRAAEMVEQAQAYQVNILADANAAVSRFDNLLSAYELDREVMRQRLYLDTMIDVYSNTPKVLLDAGDSQPIINLGNLQNGNDPALKAVASDRSSEQQTQSDSNFDSGMRSAAPEASSSTRSSSNGNASNDLRSRARPTRN
ncbi:FtsH protease activity modulator HflK [Cardiobacteriaceae bacterium TAE3-ERU3]|nr:FtsH protease activity modulator HflK [Cardiobacteriaceae bacterium TAE3-ERU3]